MVISGAATGITSSNELKQEVEADLKAKSEQALQDLTKDSEEAKQNKVDAKVKNIDSETGVGFKITGFQQSIDKINEINRADGSQVSKELATDGFTEEVKHPFMRPTHKVVSESLEQKMSTASVNNLNLAIEDLAIEDTPDVDSDTCGIPNVVQAVISDTLVTPLTQPVFSTVVQPESQRIKSLMQEFKKLLEQYQQQTLKLAKSYATITDKNANKTKNTTELDLSNIGKVAIQQHDIDGYQSGLAQLTNTLNSMESELEAALRKAEYQELSRQDLEAAHLEMLERLASTSETRCDVLTLPSDAGKEKHLDRVGALCAKIAQTLGCEDTFVSRIASSARLHDIGKLAIPDSILQKPDRLDADEYTTMKMHTIHGAEMLANNSSEIVQMAQRIALSHHENWDGSGYPYQLEREEIVLEGRIAAVADVYDALISSRIYKEAWPKEKAIEQIKSRSGTKFDPKVVEAFLKIVA